MRTRRPGMGRPTPAGGYRRRPACSPTSSCANLGGWSLFCERLGCSPGDYIGDLPGADLLAAAAEDDTFEPASEAWWLEYVRKGYPDAARVMTAETVAGVLAECYRLRLECWGVSA